MKKYKNTNFRMATPELLGLVLFTCLLVLTIYFNNMYESVKDLFNIQNTEVDYIIQAPSIEQVAELREMNHINKIVPYYYRSVDVLGGNGNRTSSLFIIENMTDVSFTTLSNELLLEKMSGSVENPLYVTDDFAKNNGVKTGDTIQLSIDGSSILFTVGGIYESDHRHVGGTVIAIKNETIENAMKSKRYAGAFIDSNDLVESGNYFKNEYLPLGDLRSRDEFDSDETYQIYLDTRNQSDTTKETFVTAEYIKELSKRNDEKLNRYQLITVACIIMAYISIMLIMLIRSGKYTRTNVLKDIKDNFTVEHEVGMYHRYFRKVGIWMILAITIVILVANYLGWISLISVITISEFFTAILTVLIIQCISVHSLKRRYLIENKKYEEEKKKEKETTTENKMTDSENTSVIQHKEKEDEARI